jgi:hypothetical protein
MAPPPPPPHDASPSANSEPAAQTNNFLAQMTRLHI